MSAVAASPVDPTCGTEVDPRVPPELEQALLEIAASERALDDVLRRASRLHRSNLDHTPRSCLVCFTRR
ncbi:hypothetical protein RB608_13140 [Nocardioides sp. LHD-245]|uniref:hypothetical protein n=1 Tax=Nocardioides sp. LHD-245 TaxID=3051387 RepID=UPI0027DF5624|nr:hypothetical protein [Nocardioides sp. LHD-245]